MGVRQNNPTKELKKRGIMGVFILILLVGVAASNPAPQLGDLFSSFSDALSGDDEPGEVNGDYKAVPYTTIQKFKGYEEREYPSVKWACTELTYTPEIEDEEEGEGFNLVKMMQKMMSKSSWKNKPSSKMFMKLFRYISGVNKDRKEIPMTVPVLSRRTPREDGSMTTDMCFYIAGYDSPMKFWNRRNEVMFVKKMSDNGEN